MHNVQDTVQQSMYYYTHTHWATELTNQNMIVLTIYMTACIYMKMCLHYKQGQSGQSNDQNSNNFVFVMDCANLYEHCEALRMYIYICTLYQQC